MASGTIRLENSSMTSGGGYLCGKIEWSSTADQAANTSQLTATLYVKKEIIDGVVGVPTTGSWGYTLSVNGESAAGSVYMAVAGDWVAVATKSVTAQHESDGTKTVTVSGSVTAPTGTSYEGKVTTGSGSAEMDSIPRASQMVFGIFTLGTAGTLTIRKASPAFTHSISYAFGSASGTVSMAGDASSVSWTPPLSLALQIPSSKTGSGTLTLRTYNGNELVGSREYPMTLTVPQSAAPTVSAGWATASYYNTGTAADSIAAFVQGFSRARVSFDSSKVATQYGATVSSFKTVCEGVTATASPYMTGVLNGTSASIVCTVTDSRGFTASETLTVTLNEYRAPTLSAISLFRADAQGEPDSGGYYIYAKATVAYASIGGLNAYDMKLYWAARSGSYGTGTAMTSGTGILVGSASPAVTYKAKITVTDRLGKSAAYEIIIPTDSVAFHIRNGGTGAAFGKYAEADARLQIPGNWKLQIGDDAMQDFIAAQHVSTGTGDWSWKKYASGEAVLYGRFSVTPASWSDAGGKYYYSSATLIEMPFEVTNAAVSGTSNAVALVTNCSVDEDGLWLRLIRWKDEVTDFTVQVVVYGKWK